MGPLTPLRYERLASGRGSTAASRGSAASATGDDLDTQQQAQIAATHRAFDLEAAERAEIMREHDALQTMLMAFLKNDTLRTIATRSGLFSVARRIRPNTEKSPAL